MKTDTKISVLLGLIVFGVMVGFSEDPWTMFWGTLLIGIFIIMILGGLGGV